MPIYSIQCLNNLKKHHLNSTQCTVLPFLYNHLALVDKTMGGRLFSIYVNTIYGRNGCTPMCYCIFIIWYSALLKNEDFKELITFVANLNLFHKIIYCFDSVSPRILFVLFHNTSLNMSYTS